jgi:hypothetical protein
MLNMQQLKRLQSSRKAQIRKCINSTRLNEEWVVYLFEDDELVERRPLGNHNYYYAQDVQENWELNIIK